MTKQEPMPKTRLDLLLDTVQSCKRELTLDCSDLRREHVAMVTIKARERGFDVSGDGRFLLIRDLREMHTDRTTIDAAKALSIRTLAC